MGVREESHRGSEWGSDHGGEWKARYGSERGTARMVVTEGGVT